MGKRTAGGWLRISLLTLLGILTALLLAVGYCLLNPNTLKPLANLLSESLTGRTLVIGGDIELDLSLTPHVVARDVRFANAAWSSEPDMVAADYIDVQIDLLQLFGNRVHLGDLEVRNGTLRLEDPVDGEPNWALLEDDESDGDWSFMVREMRLDNVSVLALIGELEPMRMEIPELSEASDDVGNLKLAGHGTLNDEPWRLDGTVGTLEELLAAGRIELDVGLSVGDVDLEAAGVIGELATMTALDMSVTVLGPDADLFGELLRMPEAFAGDVGLTADIAPSERGHAIEVRGHVAAFTVSATGTVEDLNTLDGWDTDINVQGPDAGVFGKSLQIKGFPQGPFEVAGRLHLHGGDLDLTDVRIDTPMAQMELNADFVDFPRREGAIATIHLQGGNISQFGELLRIPNLPEAAFEAALTLKGTDGDLTASMNVGAHTLAVNGYLGEFPDYLGTRLNVRLEGSDLARLLLLANVRDSLGGPYRGTTLLIVDETGINATNAEFENGPVEIAGKLNVPRPDRLEGASFTGTVRLRSLAELAHLVGDRPLPAEPLVMEATLRALPHGYRVDGGRVTYRTMVATIDGALGDLTGLDGIDARIFVEGPSIHELSASAVPEGEDPTPFTLSTSVRGHTDALELADLDLNSAGGDISATGRIALAEAYVGTRLIVRGSGKDLADTIPVLPGYTPPATPWEIEVDFALPDAGDIELARSHLAVGSVRVNLAGRLDLVDQIDTDLTVELRGDSLRDLGQIGHRELPDIPFHLATKFDGSSTGVNITRFDAEWGDSDLAASGSVVLGEIPDIVLKGTSKRMILVDVQRAIFGEPPEPEAGGDRRLFPDTPIPISYLQAFNADVDSAVGEFRGMRASMDDVDVALQLQDGALTLDRAAYRDATGSFRATGVLRPDGEEGGVALELVVRGEDANLGLFVSPDQAPDTIPRYTMDIDIKGAGQTIAELAGSLDGKILVSSDGGQIDNSLLDAYAGDFVTNVLDVLNPFSTSSRFMPMECMVMNATLNDGKLKLEPGFVMRNDRVNMFVYGSVDLKSEKLDLSMASQARRGIGISAASITNPYFKVGGTLTSPSLQLDPASAAVAASVATATAGLSIVIRGVWNRLMGERNPCPQFLDYRRSDAGS
ncbi:MAG: AsmA family protein, partial [Gammaproteobacteria bacterium]